MRLFPPVWLFMASACSAEPSASLMASGASPSGASPSGAGAGRASASASASPATTESGWAGSSWSHGWETPAAAWWGYGAMGGSLFTDAEVEFIAKTYKIVALSLCPSPMNISVSDGILNVTARIKAANPSVKVLQYFNTDQWACYPPTDPALAEFLAHPEWWLRDDHGNPIEFSRFHGGYDFSNEAAVQHFLEMPLGASGGAAILDGFLFDGGSEYSQPPNISASRAESLKLAKWRALGRQQERLRAANGGLVLAVRAAPFLCLLPKKPHASCRRMA